jgi:hypothetical protein
MVAATLDGLFGSIRFHGDYPRYDSPGDAEAKKISEPYARRRGLREEGRKEVLP